MSRCWSIDPLIISKKIGCSTANIIGRKLACSIGAIYAKLLWRGGTLWRNGIGTYNGTNDRIPNSLGEPYDDYCYKLVAAVLEKE